MGAGASHSTDNMGEGTLGKITKQEFQKIETQYKDAIKSRDKRIEELEKSLTDTVKEKDATIDKLKRKIEQLCSVLDQTMPVTLDVHASDEVHGTPNLGASEHLPGISETRQKKVAVSAEKYDDESGVSQHRVIRHPKNDKTKRFLRAAIDENTMLSHLDRDQIKELVDCMFEKTYKKGENVITEGQAGDNFYIIMEGELQAYKITSAGENILGLLNPGVVFGELAVLYNCTRTASIRVLQDTKLWAIDRQSYHFIMMQSTISRKAEYLGFMENVALLKPLPLSQKNKIADALEEEGFDCGEFIIRQGDMGDTFYIISEGEVDVTQNSSDGDKVIRTLGRGAYFGEKALLSEDNRTANVLATSECVVCVTLDRFSFDNLIGPLAELVDKNYPDLEGKKSRTSFISPSMAGKHWDDDVFHRTLKFQDLEQVATLGCGGFGRVELVKHRASNRSYALKCMQKAHIVATRQQDHVFTEKNVMIQMNHHFITRLFATYRDSRYLYMLMEVSLGGEMWTVLRDRGCFDEKTTRFFIACVVIAFEYLHKRGIIYRDLKPENLLIDNEGYVKVVDFGFAKRIGQGKKTWTFCGTPEYVAPEIVLNKGHDFSADYWSLGILIFELLTGRPPFMSHDHMQTYNMIVAGIDKLEMPKRVGKHAANLLKKLCRESPSERIGNLKDGIKDIKKHRFFQGFDWTGCDNRQLEGPIIPNIKSIDDASNFDDYPPVTDVPPEDNSGWDKDF